MVSKTVTIGTAFNSNFTLTHFIQSANEYSSLISISESDRKVNAKSLLGVLALELAEGMSVTLTADGPDETEALDHLCAMVK